MTSLAIAQPGPARRPGRRRILVFTRRFYISSAQLTAGWRAPMLTSILTTEMNTCCSLGLVEITSIQKFKLQKMKDQKWKRFYRCYIFVTLLLTVEVRGQWAVYVRSGEGEAGWRVEVSQSHAVNTGSQLMVTSDTGDQRFFPRGCELLALCFYPKQASAVRAL